MKTRTKIVATMHIGEFTAHETVLQCVECESEVVYYSEELLRMVPSGSKYGYDVMVYVGKELFLRHRHSREIRDALAARNIRISSREVDYLGKKFIVYLAIAHRQSAPRIKETMQLNGGYILHIDGTCNHKGMALVSGLDSLTEIVLGNVKLPSEKTEEIVPFLESIKRQFGIPLASVHDMGAGISKAVATVFPNNPDFICHYHFLRDIGKDLFEREYTVVRKRLRSHGITSKLRYHAKRLKQVIDEEPQSIEAFCGSVENREDRDVNVPLIPTMIAYSLIQWALEGKNQGQGYGFPFDRPHVTFAERLCGAYSQVEKLKAIHLRGEWRDNIPLFKLSHILKRVAADSTLQRTIEEIELKIEVFDKLRDAMRIAPRTSSQGLNSGDAEVDIRSIEKGVKEFCEWLSSKPEYTTSKEYQKMRDQIDKYWEKLFADPLIVNTPNGQVAIQPQRTNNIMERFFRDFRRGNRRRTGNDSINGILQAMLAETPLVKNLENHSYMKILLDGKSTLEELFSEIDTLVVRREMARDRKPIEKVPVRIRKIIAEPTFITLLDDLFYRCAPEKFARAI